MSEQRINTELLAKVRDHILEEPRRYDQGTWGKQSEEAPCGTVACLAGWTAYLGGLMTLTELQEGAAVVRERAQRALGLSDIEARMLFAGRPRCDCGSDLCEYGWPHRFAIQYENAMTDEGRARAAADYIDHIIATGKVID